MAERICRKPDFRCAACGCDHEGVWLSPEQVEQIKAWQTEAANRWDGARAESNDACYRAGEVSAYMRVLSILDADRKEA